MHIVVVHMHTHIYKHFGTSKQNRIPTSENGDKSPLEENGMIFVVHPKAESVIHIQHFRELHEYCAFIYSS